MRSKGSTLLFCCLLQIAAFQTSQVAGCYSRDADDVCKHTQNEIPHLTSRKTDILVTAEMFQWRFCDVHALNPTKWYLSSRRMADHCPDMYMCGTQFPIWLKGQNPIPEEGIVNLTACLRDFDRCCSQTYSIAAVHCGSTIAYCFNELPSGCHQRYCFDEELSRGSPPMGLVSALTTVEVVTTLPTLRVTVAEEVATTRPTKATTDIDTSNKGFREWKERFGSLPVVHDRSAIASAQANFDRAEQDKKILQQFQPMPQRMELTATQAKFDAMQQDKKNNTKRTMPQRMELTATQAKFDAIEQDKKSNTKRMSIVQAEFNKLEIEMKHRQENRDNSDPNVKEAGDKDLRKAFQVWKERHGG